MAKRDLEFQLKIDPKTGIASINKTKKAVKDFGKSASKDVDKVSRSFDKTSKSVKSFGAISKTAFALAAAGAIAFGFAMKKTIDAASDLQEVQGKFDVVFKNNIKQAEEMGKVLVDSYAMSEREAKQYLSTIQDLLVPMGMMSDKAALMAHEVVKLSADLGSFNNLPTAKVMEDIQSALVGNFETMKKYGVVLNETVLKQKALEMGLWDGKGVIDANTKSQVAFRLMLEGSAAAIGDQQRTMGSYANQVKQLKANYEGVAAAIGEKLLPVVTEWVVKTNEAIKNNPQLIEDLATIAKLTLDIASRAGSLAADIIDGWRKIGIVTGVIAGSDEMRLAYLQRIIDTGKYTSAVYWEHKKLSEKLKDLAKENVRTWADVEAEMQAFIDSKRKAPTLPKLKFLLPTKKETNNMLEDINETIKSFDMTKKGKELFDWQQISAEFNEAYGALGKTQLQLDIEAIEAQAETWRNAGLNRIEIKRWETDKITELEKTALEKWSESALSITEQMEQTAMHAAESFSSGFTDAFFDFVEGTKSAGEAFREFAASFLSDIARMIMQQLIFNAIKSAVGGGFFGAADGAVIDKGMVAYAKGGIVDKPTIFPMQKGYGLMGEAGPEAILPLQRGKGGVLGVAGGGSNVTNTKIIIHMENPVFQDLETQQQTMIKIAEVVATRVAPDAVIQNYKDDLGIRQMIRGGN